MNNAGGHRLDPVVIGEIEEPPFARVPDACRLFRSRAERFQELSAQHELAPFLQFLSEVSFCQHALQEGLEHVDLPNEHELSRARAFGMPPLDRNHFAMNSTFDATLGRFLALASNVDMPETARAALSRVTQADGEMRFVMVRAVLADAVPLAHCAEHVFVAAALQVHYARLASRLDPKKLVPVGDGACPACGGAPVSSMIVAWPGAQNTRFCVCSLCATQWNYVRIKCTMCGSTKGISYQQIDGGNGTVWAETCESCRAYVKILHQHKNPGLDPVADDVGSLSLDVLVRESEYRRGGVNPFLLGY
ncbi:formate dehydrogenase accessory protein FdhE [Bradyrhizobium sp. SYSU BS000235]|uniref:formate dehydrogenase accessory protein FdhE n=1 Tax=Bradyrhizobium sp. SYSU BS000235 TaxID=3411332 RepID=UPI003C72B3C6